MCAERGVVRFCAVMFHRYPKAYALLVGLFLFISMLGYVKYGYKIQLNGLNKLVLFKDLPSTRSRVLVTGGAGFIGFHLAKTLAADKSVSVIAVDNFNDYYDVRLKIDRAYELHKAGITVYDEDVCNEDFLEEIFVEHDITHVAHLAAQAGVRYSLENPLAYVKANVQCQLALLNAIRDHPQDIKLVYASSSSVYGKESEIPFRLSARTDHPGNMYAATKKTDELLGLQYCVAHGLQSVGLRFFTVYGEWGRPDMSVYKFAEAILNGKEIPMFHVSDDKPLGRDFTFVDDVVSGIVAALHYQPKKCGQRFNLGFGNPVSVPDMITILQNELGIKGQVKKLPLPPTEILKTWADIETSRQLLGFTPKTNLTLGLRAFVKWFKFYMEERKEQEASGRVAASVQWYASLVEDRIQRHVLYSANKQSENNRVTSRYIHEKHKYNEPSQMNAVVEIKYKAYSNVDSVSADHDIGTLHNLQHNSEAMKAECNALENCIAFTTSGTLKSAVLPRSKWSYSGETLHIRADTNWCDTDLHMCHKRARCTPSDTDLYVCECTRGYVGDGLQCLPVHGKIATQDIYEDNIMAYHAVFNASQLKRNAKTLRYDGVDSPGGDYLVLDGSRTVEELTKLCAEQPICIGFSTNGRLKKQIKQPDKWIVSENEALVIYDVNYCLLSEDACAQFSACTSMGQGDYRCVCQKDYAMLHGQCTKLFIDRSLVPSLSQCVGNVCV